MGWKLAPGIGYCETGGTLVFLDLARDKYLALCGADRAAFERLRGGEPNDSETIARLIRTGLIMRCNGATVIAPTRIDVPSRDLASACDERFSPAAAWTAARALRWARRAMRPEHIAATIAALQPDDANIPVEADAEVEAVAARYAASRWADPIAPRCLVDALALGRIIRSRGRRAVLVFGVRLAPFAAHCWLQTSNVVLTGTAAEARNYTPILAAG